MSEPGQPVALFVGDSYTAGYDGVDASQTFACQVAAALQWSCRTDAQGGTGYVNAGTRPGVTSAYGGRLAATAADLAGQAPAWVVVTGGRNDVGRGGVRKAAGRYFTALRVLYPTARLVVVEPFWGDVTAPAAVDVVRGDVRAAADQAGARWVKTGDWLTPGLIGPDRVHPTLAGQARIADQLTTDLENIEVKR